LNPDSSHSSVCCTPPLAVRPLMKLFALTVFKWKAGEKPVLLAGAWELGSFNIFQRSTVKDFMTMFARTVVERGEAGARSQVQQEDYVAYIHKKSDGLAALLICDKEYPSRVAFTFVSQTVSEFPERHRGKWEPAEVQADYCIDDPRLAETLAKYQSPEEADKILRIQKDLEETKTIMHQAIGDLLARGEKLDDLVQMSGDLGSASKAFYSTATLVVASCDPFG